MRMIHICLLMIASSYATSQKHSLGYTAKPDTLFFNDTIQGVSLEGVKRNVFLIRSESTFDWNKSPQENCQGEFYFKIISNEEILIKKSFTGDPHFINRYPNEEIFPNEIYSFTVSFSFQSRPGPYNKVLGFELADGTRFYMKFVGCVLKAL
jgi:hypothetical protein